MTMNGKLSHKNTQSVNYSLILGLKVKKKCKTIMINVQSWTIYSD